MASSGKISVVIPSFNSEKTIGHCINAVLDQTIPPDEVLVVDCDSEDKTWEILSQYQLRCPQLKLLFCAKRSASAARNLGIQQAQFQSIVCLDSDVSLESQALEYISGSLDKNSVVFGKTLAPKGAPISTKIFIEMENEEITRSPSNSRCFGFHHSLKSELFFDEGLKAAEDLELFNKGLRVQKTVLEKPIGVHLKHLNLKNIYRLQKHRSFWTKKVQPTEIKSPLWLSLWSVYQLIKSAAQVQSLPYSLTVISSEWGWQKGLK